MSDDVDAKVERLARFARAQYLAGVLVSLQPNFAWLSDGGSNRIDGSTDVGNGTLFVAQDAHRYVIANTIEMTRLHGEALVGLAFEPIEYPWTDDQTAPGRVVELARRVAGEDRIGSDASLPGARAVDLTDLRTPLTDAELSRYRALGEDVGGLVGAVCRSLGGTGQGETDVAQALDRAVTAVGARPIVTLVAADERIARYRHPVPTTKPWRKTLLVGLCAERQGLVVALTRIVAKGAAADALMARTRAAASVWAALLRATRPGARAADLFQVAAATYSEMGFAGEERRHHQGGAIGYQSRDWMAHPASTDVVTDRQAFAWNPSITGTKVEDTVLLVDGRVQVITRSPEWPLVGFDQDGVAASGIMLL